MWLAALSGNMRTIKFKFRLSLSINKYVIIVKYRYSLGLNFHVLQCVSLSEAKDLLFLCSGLSERRMHFTCVFLTFQALPFDANHGASISKNSQSGQNMTF